MREFEGRWCSPGRAGPGLAPGLPCAVSQSLARGEDWVGYSICQHECSASWCGGLVVRVGASMASGRGAPAEIGNQILSRGPLNQVQGIKGLQQ